MVKEDNVVVKDVDSGVDCMGSSPGSPIKLWRGASYVLNLSSVQKMARTVPTS